MSRGQLQQQQQEALYEGWLTKSPPTKRVWRGRWRRRWFSLQCGEIPGQYVLIYYTDRNCRKIKGAIDLEHCEQVDSGLKFDEGKLKFDYLFDIKTPQRTYYLAADSEVEMKNWVKNICGVCNLKATSDDDEVFSLTNMLSNRHLEEEAIIPSSMLQQTVHDLNNKSSSSTLISNKGQKMTVSTSPYIPISECITGKSPLLPGQKITDFHELLQHNLRNNSSNLTYESAPNNLSLNSINQQGHQQQHLTYHNIAAMLDSDPRSYDLPRLLLQPPPCNSNKVVTTLGRHQLQQDKENRGRIRKDSSPLQSPTTDTESVFTDDDNWLPHQTSHQPNQVSNPRPSDSSSIDDGRLFNTSNVSSQSVVPPPRPPKPSSSNLAIINAPAANYLNLPVKEAVSRKDSTSSTDNKQQHIATGTLNNTSFDSSDNTMGQGVINDEMYDFPRAHQNEMEFVRNTLLKRHCYNNAAPGISNIVGGGNTEGQIFRYDMSPTSKPSSSTSQIFRYDMMPEDCYYNNSNNSQCGENNNEPASPLSQSSSTAVYSNLPSPLLLPSDCKLMPPPIVDRGLKPKRKTSDTISITSIHSMTMISSNNEPSSPRNAPSVDRTLKPSNSSNTKTLPSSSKSSSATNKGHARKWSEPSHVRLPTTFKRSFESFLSDMEQIYYPLSPDSSRGGTKQDYYKLEYLDLDLDNVSSNINNLSLQQPLRSPGAGTVYKKVDFTKTEAFNITRNNLEKERKETEPFLQQQDKQQKK